MANSASLAEAKRCFFKQMLSLVRNGPAYPRSASIQPSTTRTG